MNIIRIHRRSDRFLVVLFALIGAVAGFLLFFLLSSPVDPVSVVVGESTLQGPHSDATLTVTLFRRFGYTRTAAAADAFEAEVIFWGLAPLVFSVLLGALVGGLAGYGTGRWLPHARF